MTLTRTCLSGSGGVCARVEVVVTLGATLVDVRLARGVGAIVDVVAPD